MMLPDYVYIVFLFVLGACVGSFLNVVVWRLPRNKSLLYPPSACPKCGHRLGARDNIPIFGWILLRGKCRYCLAPVSARYPTIEAITGLLFVLYYVAFFILKLGPSISSPGEFGTIDHTMLTTIDAGSNWAVYGLILVMICGLLAASLIDAELFIIPIEIPWVVALVAFVVHAGIADRTQPGALSVGPVSGAVAAGSALGLVISTLLLKLGRLPQSFPQGEPILEFERKELEKQLKEQPEGKIGELTFDALPPVATKGEIRKEILKEALFLLIPLVLAVIAPWVLLKVPAFKGWWVEAIGPGTWLTGLLGAVYGAVIGAMAIWVTRVCATFALGRVAMGQGDTHLMVAIGAVLGAGPALVVFFFAPFCGVLIGVYQWLTKGRNEMPYGPYLSLAAGMVVLVYRYVGDWFAPGMVFLSEWIGTLFGV